MATRCRFFRSSPCTHPKSTAEVTLTCLNHWVHKQWLWMDSLAQSCIYSACTCTLWFLLVRLQASSAFYLIRIVPSSPWSTSNQIARLTSPSSEIVRIMAMIEMQRFRRYFEAILTLTISWIRIVFFQLIQQPCIGIITFSAAWMSPLPTMV